MKTTDHLIDDFTNENFQAAFKLYFAELDIKVEHWDELFAEMNNDPHGPNYAFLRTSEDGRTIGFIQFTTLEIQSWFFASRVGFVREFWVAEAYRSSGHGSAMLALAEDYFLAHDLRTAILTSDTAERFYQKHGYHQIDRIKARNDAPVFVKLLHD